MEFMQLIKEKLKLLDIDQAMLSRAVNEGFSGGEKKRNEIFQMALLEPKLAILDETDSGLDIDALKIVADGVNALRSPERAIIVVTHYQRLLDYIVPDFVHVLSGGRIVKSGGKELALELEEKGYGWIEPRAGRRQNRHDTAGREASTVARDARRAAARRSALAPGPARSRGVALRRARVSRRCATRSGGSRTSRRSRRPSSSSRRRPDRARGARRRSCTPTRRSASWSSTAASRRSCRGLPGFPRACASARWRRRRPNSADVVGALSRPARRLQTRGRSPR